MKLRLLFMPLVAAALVAPALAYASLGDDVSSMQADQLHMKGSLRVLRTELNYTVKEIQLPSGTKVREYVAKNGTIFGVAWKGATKPNLNQLLGQYYESYKSAPRVGFNRSNQTIQTADLVVHATGHMRAYAGNAYVLSLLPQGVTPKEIN